MGKKNIQIDTYINQSAEFARPILEYFRLLVHTACPQISETIKWGFPNFEYKGIVCSMAAFKRHCSISFRKAGLLKDPLGLLQISEKNGMGNFDKITSVSALPDKHVLISYIKEAVSLNENKIKIPLKTLKKTPLPAIPPELKKALLENKKASATFANFSDSNKREYILWLNEAKTPQTFEKRLATTLSWLEEGKIRNWKYVK
ncbi:MAG: YdeI/OmpD-associated family protein [Chitinophagaceae bacterium]